MCPVHEPRMAVRRMAAGVLACWLVLLSGIVYPQLTSHAAKHAHHNAATHATALCSWLCVAADSVLSLAVVISPVEPVTPIVRTSHEARITLFTFPQPPVRAPPTDSRT